MHPADMTLPKALSVFIMDMLCMTPHYDHYLTRALAESKKVNVVLGSISFHLDTTYLRRSRVPMQAWIIDVVAKLGISHKAIRQTLKLLEYVLNLFILRVRFLLKMPDIVHVQWIPLITKTTLELWFMRSVQKQGAKIVFTVHNTLPHDTGDRYKKIFSRIYHTADALICHTDSAKSEIIEKFGIAQDKISVIPHGPLFHEAKRYSSQEARAVLNIPSGRTVVLLFGLLRPYKGAEFLLDAWKRVIEKDGNALLVIAGNGEPSYITQLNERIAKLQLNNTVRPHFRYINENEVPVYFSAADILVYPYKEITQSGALLTGMSFGKPIVATSLEGFVETLENGRSGVLVSYGNVDQMADSILMLIREPQTRKRFAKEAANAVSARFSWGDIAERTLQCYRSQYTS